MTNKGNPIKKMEKVSRNIFMSRMMDSVTVEKNAWKCLMCGRVWLMQQDARGCKHVDYACYGSTQVRCLRKEPVEVPFKEIADWIKTRVSPSDRTKCVCGRELVGRPVVGYPHNEGWSTRLGQYWLYIPCTCGHNRSIWKMGISRGQDFSQIEVLA